MVVTYTYHLSTVHCIYSNEKQNLFNIDKNMMCIEVVPRISFSPGYSPPVQLPYIYLKWSYRCDWRFLPFIAAR